MLDQSFQSDFQPDRRQAVRRRTRHKAKVVVNAGWSTFDAEILNLSPDGALVQLDGLGAIPETFELRFHDRKRLVTSVWSRGLKAGVIFEA